MAYNTAPFHGKVCRTEKNDVAMDFMESWSINVTTAMAGASRQGQQWDEALPGMTGWTGSFSGMVVLGNTEQKAFVDNIITAIPGVKLTDVKFLLDGSTNAYTGNIYINSYSLAPSLTDVVKHTFNFQGDGALSVTAAA